MPNIDWPVVAILIGLGGQTMLMGKWSGSLTTSVASLLSDFREFKAEVRKAIGELLEGQAEQGEAIAELKGRFDTFERRRDR